MENTILSDILEVFSGMATWVSGAVTSLLPMFYVAETGLTIIGILTVAGLSLSVTFLLIGVISNFIHFRG